MLLRVIARLFMGDAENPNRTTTGDERHPHACPNETERGFEHLADQMLKNARHWFLTADVGDADRFASPENVPRLSPVRDPIAQPGEVGRWQGAVLIKRHQFVVLQD